MGRFLPEGGIPSPSIRNHLDQLRDADRTPRMIKGLSLTGIHPLKVGPQNQPSPLAEPRD